MTHRGGSGVRQQLATVVAVTMSLVLLAFLVPLGIVLRQAAEDRATAAASDDAQRIAALIAVDPSAVGAVDSSPGGGIEISVFLGDGTVTGTPAARTDSVELAGRGLAFTAARDGGVEALVPVQGLDGGTAVVRAYAPEAALHAGVTRTWLVLGLLGLALLALGLLLADRLGRRLVDAVTGLAGTADRLAGGDLEARAVPDGPRELRRVGLELNRLADRIGELLHAEREEVADLAHRLRTPVTALRLDAEAVRDAADRDRLGADVDRLTRMVDEMIRTARRPVREGLATGTDLVAVVAARLAFWAPLAEDDGREVTSSLPPAPILVRGAEADLAAAVDALVQNVFAHTPDGTAMRVEVAARPEGGGRLTVADSGPGFDAEAAARGASGGSSTGLGLDIARRTAEAAGGTMTITRADPGGGATVARGEAGGAAVILTFAAPGGT